MKRLLKNNIIKFIFTKYLTFALQMLNSILIAKKLSINLFGIYGFAILILQYFSYSNLGLNYSYSVISSSIKKDANYNKNDLISTSLNLQIIISLVLLIVFLIGSKLNLFNKYNFNDYFFILIIITILQQINILLVNIFRIENKINGINFFYFITPFLQLISIIFLKDIYLFYGLLYSNILGCMIAIIFFHYESPIIIKNIKFLYFKNYREILTRGLYLLAYNFTFYGIMLSTRTIVGKYFSIEDFALFNFSNTISNSVFLLLGSINFLFYPKLIRMITDKNTEEIFLFIDIIRRYYLTLTVLIVFISLFFLPLLFLYIPDYSNSIMCIQILLLWQILLTNSFGFSTLLIQRKKELSMTLIALMAILIIIFTSFISFYLTKKIEIIATCMLIGVLCYNFFIIKTGVKNLNLKPRFIFVLQIVFKLNLFIPVFLYLILSYFYTYYYINLSITFLIYIIFNRKDLKKIVNLVLSIIKNEKNIISI